MKGIDIDAGAMNAIAVLVEDDAYWRPPPSRHARIIDARAALPVRLPPRVITQHI